MQTWLVNTAGYLRRIGLPSLLNAPTSAENLRALHAAHLEKVTYEALEIWLDRPTTVDPVESAERIIGGAAATATTSTARSPS